MFPAIVNETDALVGYLDDQLAALRVSAHGLTDAQARATPCRSALSIGGLLKHATWVMWTQIVPGPGEEAPVARDDFLGSLRLAEDESFEEVLAWFDDARARYLRVVAALDPDEVFLAAPRPWEGIVEEHEASRRVQIIHHVEELARHAGHADILREELDGGTALPLRMAVEGIPGNEYAQPWHPGLTTQP